MIDDHKDVNSWRNPVAVWIAGHDGINRNRSEDGEVKEAIIGVGNRRLVWVYGEFNRSYPSTRLLYSDGRPSLNSQSVSSPPPCPHAEHYHESSSTRLIYEFGDAYWDRDHDTRPDHRLDACGALHACTLMWESTCSLTSGTTTSNTGFVLTRTGTTDKQKVSIF